jgi:CheY-like chemotaxis protein
LLHIMVADDSSTIQKVIKIALSKFAVQITEASTLIEALGAVSRTAFDLLVVDASLPGAKGASDFQKLAEKAPVLLLLGSYEAVDDQAFRNAGLTAFVRKPFESKDIVERMDQLLQGRLRGPKSATEIRPPETKPQEIRPPRQESIAQDFSDEDDEESGEGLGAAVPPPPPPRRAETEFSIPTDATRKGRPAFEPKPEPPPRHATTTYIPPSMSIEEAEKWQSQRPKATPAPTKPVKQDEPHAATQQPEEPRTETKAVASSVVPLDLNDLAEQLEALVEERLTPVVRTLLTEYCQQHFQALAREILTQELRRLADERSRYLVDS